MVKYRRLLTYLLIAAALVAAVTIGATQQMRITDWWALRNYQPSSTIASLADDTTMNDAGRHIFYVNHPAVEAGSEFVQSCPLGTEKTIVLGCYRSSQHGIYILSVSDARLKGVEQVTAAHEMLHAAYERLSKKDREYIDGLLTDFYESKLKDKRIRNVLELYKETEPNDIIHEMHSIFGTELMVLTPELETYYARYFEKRERVAVYAGAYQKAFTSREAAVKSYDVQLANMKKKIEINNTMLQDQAQDLIAERAELDTFRRQGNIKKYNARVSHFNQAVEAYNELLKSNQKLVGTYNEIVAKRNAIAIEEQELLGAIQGTVAPMPSE